MEEGKRCGVERKCDRAERRSGGGVLRTWVFRRVACFVGWALRQNIRSLIERVVVTVSLVNEALTQLLSDKSSHVRSPGSIRAKNSRGCLWGLISWRRCRVSCFCPTIT